MWTLAPLDGPVGTLPKLAALGSLECLKDQCGAHDLWDHLGRHVVPMLAMFATTTVAVTVAAGTRCARYGITGPLDAEQLPPGPGTEYSPK